MPRGPRLDAPGALHHVMVRGIERRVLFADDHDRQAWLDRLASVVKGTDSTVLAWAIVPNHAHLLVRTGSVPLATGMRRLLTGYAGAFNRRHARIGRLFHNRYKSILVEEEPYLLELVRYIHLNPLRAGLVANLAALDRYPWTGHSAVMDRLNRPWQAVGEVLGQFAGRRGLARRRYREFVAAGLAQGRRPELAGGGLRRSRGLWTVVERLGRGREQWASDERILGSSEFVEAVKETTAIRPTPPAVGGEDFARLVTRCAEGWEINTTGLVGGSRRRPVARVRAILAHLGVQELGLPVREIARHLGVTPAAIQHALPRGATLLAASGRTAKELLATNNKYHK